MVEEDNRVFVNRELDDEDVDEDEDDDDCLEDDIGAVVWRMIVFQDMKS